MNAAPDFGPKTFEAFYSLGYTRLVPIVPPTAQISPKSSLANRPKSLGKAVGIKGPDGLWHGIDWIPYESDARDCARWQNMGAGVGIKTGRQLIGIDADAYSEADAATILEHICRHFGPLPARTGRFPKTLYVCALTDPMPYTRIDFGPRNEKGQLRDRVEILSDGRQFVAAGVHPETKLPYTWGFPLVRRERLPVFSPAQIIAFLEDLRQVLPAAQPRVTEGATSNVSQASLKGDLAMVRKAVAATPNSSKAFGTREQWLGYGYAIKAALPDNQAEALEIYGDWSSRWIDEKGEPVSPGNTPEYIAAEWSRFKPPFRRGASWLFELAEEHNPAAFQKVDVWFDKIDEPVLPAIASPTLQPTPYAFPDPAQIPVRQWLYGDHYIRGFVSATVAPGGVGKSSLTIVEALAMASGKPLLGVEPKGQFRVWLWNGEDPREELNRRIAAAMMHYRLSATDIGDRLLVDTGQEQEIILATEARNGAVVSESVAAAVVSALRRNKVDALVIDPFVSSHRVNENDNGAIDLVVKRWSKIATAAGVAVEVVHHVRKTNGAEVTVEDARGATALVNGARVTRALTRMTEQDGRRLGIERYWRYFRFGGVTKNNLAPTSASPVATADWFTLRSEQLGNGKGDGLEALMSGDAVGVVIKAEVEDMTEAQDPDQAADALRLIADGNWRADVRAGDAWVGYPVARAYELDATDKADKARINGILKRLRQDGRIFDEARPDRSRHVRQFVRVAKLPTTPTAAAADSIFD